MKDIYPGPRTLDEAQRLQSQHALVTSALGSLVPFPLDLSQPNLQILDNATADGYWLFDLRGQLARPESATLVGADITDFPAAQRSFEVPANLEFVKHDMREPWPASFHQRFDLVHQRAAMAGASTFEGCVAVAAKLLGNVKPGGWLLLVDSCLSPGEIKDEDKPSEKMFKVVANLVLASGMDTSNGKTLPQILEAAGKQAEIELSDAGSLAVDAVIGKGAVDGAEEIGYAWLRGMSSSVGGGLAAMGSRAPMVKDDFENLILQVMGEAQSRGVKMPWYAAWARRSQ